MLALMDSHDEEPTNDEVLEVWKQVAQNRLNSLDRGDTNAVQLAEAKARFLAL
jgi:Putative addiction module component